MLLPKKLSILSLSVWTLACCVASADTPLYDTYLKQSEEALESGNATKAEQLARSAADEAKISNDDEKRVNAEYLQALALTDSADIATPNTSLCDVQMTLATHQVTRY